MDDVLDAPAVTAALAYGAFTATMTIGRMLTDRVAARVGPVVVVRYGSILAALGFAIVAVAPSIPRAPLASAGWAIPVALTGWAVLGIGVSGGVPQLFSAAGHAVRTAAGTNISRVASLGYLGLLAGPAIVGPLTRFMPLTSAFFFPSALCLVVAFAAPVLRPAARGPTRRLRNHRPHRARSTPLPHGPGPRRGVLAVGPDA